MGLTSQEIDKIEALICKGLPDQASSRLFESDEEDGVLRRYLQLSVSNDDGETILTAEACIKPGSDEAKLTSMLVQEDHQGGGLGKTALRNIVVGMGVLGATKIAAEATEVGAYAWTRFGFAPLLGDAWNKVVGYGIQDLEFLVEDGELTAEQCREVETILLNPDPREVLRLGDLPYMVSDRDDEGKQVRIGQRILLNTKFDVRLDLEDQVQSRRFFDITGLAPAMQWKRAEVDRDTLAAVVEHVPLPVDEGCGSNQVGQRQNLPMRKEHYLPMPTGQQATGQAAADGGYSKVVLQADINAPGTSL